MKTITLPAGLPLFAKLVFEDDRHQSCLVPISTGQLAGHLDLPQPSISCHLSDFASAHVLSWVNDGQNQGFAWKEVSAVQDVPRLSNLARIQLDVTSRTSHKRGHVNPKAQFLVDRPLHGVTELDSLGQPWRSAERISAGRNLTAVSGPALECINGVWPAAGRFAFQRANVQVIKAKLTHVPDYDAALSVAESCTNLVLASGLIMRI